MSKQKIVNIPNSITLFRLLLAIPMIYFILARNYFYSAITFIIIIIFDSFDGILARKLKQETEFGKFFDSTADASIMILAFFFLYIAKHSSFIILLLLVISRILSSFVVLYFYKRKRIFYKPFYTKSGGFAIYILLIYLLLVQRYNIYIVFLCFFYAYFTLLISYIKIALDVLLKPAGKKQKR